MYERADTSGCYRNGINLDGLGLVAINVGCIAKCSENSFSGCLVFGADPVNVAVTEVDDLAEADLAGVAAGEGVLCVLRAIDADGLFVDVADPHSVLSGHPGRVLVFSPAKLQVCPVVARVAANVEATRQIFVKAIAHE